MFPLCILKEVHHQRSSWTILLLSEGRNFPCESEVVICSEIIRPQMRSKARAYCNHRHVPAGLGNCTLLRCWGQFSVGVLAVLRPPLRAASLQPLAAARAPRRGFLRFNKHCSMRWPQSTILPAHEQFLSCLPPHSHKFNAKMRKYFSRCRLHPRATER